MQRAAIAAFIAFVTLPGTVIAADPPYAGRWRVNEDK
jgi:hypothetical protein